MSMFGRSGGRPVSRIEGVRPDLFSPPRPGLWRRWAALLASAVLLAAAAGWGVDTVRRTCGGLGSGVYRVDGQCVGVTDGSYVFDPGSRHVQELIKKENDWVAEESRRRGQRHVAIALLAPLTRTDGSPYVGDKRVRLLQGAHVAQRRANREPALVGDTRPLIQLLLANEGGSQKQWKPVVEELVKRMGDDNPLVAVIGMGVSVDETEDAARALAEHDIPMVGAGIAADGLSQADAPGRPGIPGLIRVSPSNVDYVTAVREYLVRHGMTSGAGTTRSAMMVYDETPTDRFVQDLQQTFKEFLLDGDLFADFPSQAFRSKSTELQPAAFSAPVLNICSQRPDVILYAGREIDLETFLRALGNRSCTDLPIRIVTATTGYDTIQADALKEHGISILYASSNDGRHWMREPAPASRPQHFGGYARAFADVFGSDPSVVQGHSIMHHDAFLAAAQAIRAAELRLDSPGDGRSAARIVKGQLLNLNSSLAVPGASGTICFSRLRQGDPENKPVPVLSIPAGPEVDEQPYLTPSERCTPSPG